MIAIIYTGQTRTIDSVIDIFKSNILIHENCHVFGLLESTNIDYYDLFIKNKLGIHLKSLQWFEKNDTWHHLKTQLLNDMHLTPNWHHYISNSGSMIEYYQMYLAYQQLKAYEIQHHITYDYILRIRCDCVITRPLNFPLYNIEDITMMVNQIKNMHQTDNIDDIVSILMTSLYDSNRAQVKMNRRHYGNVKFTDNFIEELYHYLKEGKFLITLRENVCYFAKRNVFDLISPLGITYGKSKTYDDGQWFNAEGQLKSICLDNGIDIFDSGSDIEIKSLYEYNQNNYYENNQLKLMNDCLFFLKRS